MFIKAGSILIVLLCVLNLNAQRDTLNIKYEVFQPKCDWDYGAGARFSFLDFEEMNRSLSAAGLPELESPVPCVALAARSSIFWRHLQLEAGLEFTSGSSQKTTAIDRQSVVFRDYALRSRMLLDMLPQNRLSKIFPFVGVGVSYQSVRTKMGLNNLLSPGQTSPTEVKEQRFTLAPLVCELGLSLEQGVPVRNKDVFVGLRVGYAFRFIENNWIVNDSGNVDLPKPAASAPFLALMLRIKSAPKQDVQSRLKRVLR